MKRFLDFESDDYLDEEIELAYRRDRNRNRRFYEARREIERRQEIKRLRKMLDYDSDSYLEF